MGVKTNLAGITLTAADITKAESLSTDLPGMMAEAQTRCQELTVLLNYIVNDILTPAGDSANASTITTQVNALS
jgi:thiamine biosynthesis lipoprotein ApbE